MEAPDPVEEVRHDDKQSKIRNNKDGVSLEFDAEYRRDQREQIGEDCHDEEPHANDTGHGKYDEILATGSDDSVAVVEKNDTKSERDDVNERIVHENHLNTRTRTMVSAIRIGYMTNVSISN